MRSCFLERPSRTTLPPCGYQELNLLAAAHTTGERDIPLQELCHRQRGVDWQMKTDDARCKLASVYPRIKL
jgi:hypothetical protein